MRVCGVIVGALCLSLFSLHAQAVAPHAVKGNDLELTTAKQRQTHGPDTRISLDVRDSTRLWLVKTIASRAGLKPTFLGGVAQLDTRITVRLVNLPVLAAVAEVLNGSSLTARLAPDGITLMVRSDSSKTRTTKDSVSSVGRIVGRVIDSASGEGIGGVTVAMRRISLATTTDRDGRFSLQSVPTGEHIVSIRLLGYTAVHRTVQVRTNESTTLQIALQTSATVLSGVITTATGEQRKLEVGNSITSINVDSVMRVAPVSSLTDLLETRVPGLAIQHTSGTPGDPSRLRLRGAASINGNNDPIVIVDGVRIYAAQSDARNRNLAPATGDGGVSLQSTYAAPSPIDQVDPNSIETIDVLKGPSAAAMYGSDAANGVIVITTKRGKSGPAQWNVAFRQGVSYMPGEYPEGIYRFGRLSYLNISLVCQITNLQCVVDSLVRFQALNDPYYTVLGRGNLSEASATLSGGSQALRYSLTGSASTDQGIFKLSRAMIDGYRLTRGTDPSKRLRRPDRLNRWSGRGSLTTYVNSTLNMTLSSSLDNREQRRSSLGFGVIRQLVGTYLRPIDFFNFADYNRVYELVESNSLSSTHVLQVNWQPVSWLPLAMATGLNTINRDDQALLPRGFQLNVTDSIGHFGVGRASTVERTVTLNTRIPTLTDRVMTAVGLNFVKETFTDMQADVTGLPAGVNVPASGLMGRHNTGGRSTFGWFVEPRLNLNSRFFVMPGFRLDNNGLSGSSARLLSLPKMNLSWIASEESFFPAKELISLFRLRFGVGSAGVQPGPTDRLRLFAIDTATVALPQYQGGATISNLGNTELRPERSTEFEGGFDVEVWQGRLVAEVTGYRKTRHDAIVPIPIPLSVSPGSLEPTISANIGVIRNSGVELNVNAQVLESSALGWNVGVSLSQNTNVVVRLNAGQDPITIQSTGGESGVRTRILPGYPLWGRWAKPIVSYGDANKNGIIEEQEVVVGDSVVYLGQQDPRSQVVFNTNVTLLNGRVSMFATFNYSSGGTQLNSTESGTYSPFNTAINNPSASLAQQAAVVAPTPYARIQSVSTLRFQTLSVNYAVGESIAQLFRVRIMSIALQGSNLGLRSNYHGKDPNVNSYPTGNVTVDSGALPAPRTWSLRITLGN